MYKHKRFDTTNLIILFPSFVKILYTIYKEIYKISE